MASAAASTAVEAAAAMEAPAAHPDAAADHAAAVTAAYHAAAITNDQSKAPDAVRSVTDRICRGLERYDFDVGGPIYGGRALKVVDVGNVPEYTALYARFAALLKARQSDADFTPFACVADAFLLGTRATIEPFV